MAGPFKGTRFPWTQERMEFVLNELIQKQDKYKRYSKMVDVYKQLANKVGATPRIVENFLKNMGRDYRDQMKSFLLAGKTPDRNQLKLRGSTTVFRLFEEYSRLYETESQNRCTEDFLEFEQASGDEVESVETYAAEVSITPDQVNIKQEHSTRDDSSPEILSVGSRTKSKTLRAAPPPVQSPIQGAFHSQNAAVFSSGAPTVSPVSTQVPTVVQLQQLPVQQITAPFPAGVPMQRLPVQPPGIPISQATNTQSIHPLGAPIPIFPGQQVPVVESVGTTNPPGRPIQPVSASVSTSSVGAPRMQMGGLLPIQIVQASGITLAPPASDAGTTPNVVPTNAGTSRPSAEGSPRPAKKSRRSEVPLVAENLPDGLSEFERRYLQSLDTQNKMLADIARELKLLRNGFFCNTFGRDS